MDYCAHYMAKGDTLTELAAEFTRTLRVGEISNQLVRRVLVGQDGEERVAAALRSARLVGAGNMMEQTRTIADSVSEDRDAIAKAKLRTDVRARIAAGWNREEWGESKSPLVQISASELHIDAMRQHAIRNPLRATAKVVEEKQGQEVALVPHTVETEESTS